METMFSCRLADVTKSTRTASHPLELRIRWSPKAFLQSQYGSVLDLGDTLVLVGSIQAPHVTRSRDYLLRVWPSLGQFVLGCIQQMAESSSQTCTAVTSATQLEFKCDEEYLHVSVSGHAVVMYGVLDILTWMAAACRSSSSPDQLATCEPLILACTPDKFDFDISLRETSLEIGHLERESSCCWWNMFRDATIAVGYPSPVRNNNERGLEVPFSLLPVLSRTYWLAEYNGKTLLKGYNSILNLVEQCDESVQWHLLVNKDQSRMSYTEGDELASLQGANEAFFSERRHFVGWAPSAVVLAGKWSSRLGRTILTFLL